MNGALAIGTERSNGVINNWCQGRSKTRPLWPIFALALICASMTLSLIPLRRRGAVTIAPSHAVTDAYERSHPDIRAFSAQTANSRQSSKGSVKGDDLLDAGIEGYFRYQMVCKTNRALAGCFQRFPDQGW